MAEKTCRECKPFVAHTHKQGICYEIKWHADLGDPSGHRARAEKIHTCNEPSMQVELCPKHATAEQERDELRKEVERLRSALQSKHNYGTASPGEQEEGWRNYCKRTGWDQNSHPAAKSAYIEGYCDGDSYSEGDESRVVLRKEVERLRAAAQQVVNETWDGLQPPSFGSIETLKNALRGGE